MGQIIGAMRVKQSTVAIKETFGKFDGVLQPGCHCVPWCCGSYIAGELSTRLQTLSVRCETKTKDDVFVTLAASIEYRTIPEGASVAFYKLNNTRELIEFHAVDAIRASVANLYMNEAYEKKQEIAAVVGQELKRVTLDFGIDIAYILIVEVEPAEPTKRAMSEINAAAVMRKRVAKSEELKKAGEEVESEYLDDLQLARCKDFKDKIRTTTKEMEKTSSST